MSDEPKFLLGNYTSRYCDVTPSSNSTIVSRVYDNDRETYWESDGELGEAGFNTTLEVILRNSGGALAPQSVDAIAIRGTNIKKFRLRYSATAAGAYATITNITVNGVLDVDGEVPSNTDTDLYITFSVLTIGKIQLEIWSTEPAAAEKKVGEFMVMKTNYTATKNLVNYKPRFIEKGGSYRLEDGTLRTWFEYRKYRATIVFDFVDETMMINLRDIKMTGGVFCIYPEPDSQIGYVWSAEWSSDWNSVYIVKYKGAGYKVTIALEGA